MELVTKNLNKHWNEYCKENNTDALYLINEDKSKMIYISAGSGDNLDHEDRDEGYVDYWNIEVYKKYDYEGHKGALECAGGLFLKETYIQEENPLIKDIVIDCLEFIRDEEGCDIDGYRLLSEKEGEELFSEFEYLSEQHMNTIRSMNQEEMTDLMNHVNGHTEEEQDINL